ncbi:hypothetical protein MOQ72_11895 [Saccharopolyspora sp. K220]|uniref:hypothetical protein n=1 Tax=Saccharopolyspora soli TaxID=2926618 RepID=UPI001F598D1C|nr:hypothetical protein [Saccharopolyspora soli]MCI2418130.1 hypothetical protein [Saccharopolyspora soli]
MTGPEAGDLRAVGPVERRAPHADHRIDEQVELCRAVVSSEQGLRYLAHYNNGIFNFAVHDVQLGADDPHELIGRHFSSEVNEIDRTLRGIRSGRLIRTVLQTTSGAIYCCSVRSNEYLVGYALEASAVDSADAATVGLVAELRRRLGESTNPGGWFVPKPTGEDSDEVPEPGGEDGPRGENLDDTMAFELVRSAVSFADLHYAALWRGGEPSAIADQFDHRRAARFFTQIDAEARRGRYRDLGARLPTVVGQLSRIVGEVLGIRTTRLTLDLEQGAIYYRRVRAGEFLVGVTLDQGRVARAEHKVADLATQLAGTRQPES